MTEQEFSAIVEDEEVVLLTELGETLKATPALDLPADFARRTARLAEQRFQQLSRFSRAALRLEPVLGAPVASPRVFPLSLALLGGTIVSPLFGQQVVGDLGLGLLALVLLWKLFSSFWLPRTGPPRSASLPAPTLAIFYLLPLASAAVSAIFCGGVVAALSLFSINFKVASWNTVLLGPVAGVGVFLYLLSALLPTWKALQRHSVGRPRWMVLVQLVHALWFGTLASALTVLYDPKLNALWVWLPVLLFAALVGWVLGGRGTLEDEGRPALWKALHKSGRSLLLGGLPIAGLLVVAYQATLTRRVDQQQAYESIVTEVSAWAKGQQAIAPDQNGWTLLRAALTSRAPKRPELAEQLKAGGTVYEPFYDDRYWEKPDSKAKWAAAREKFLKALPVVREALAKPEFSAIQSQGFKMQSLVPNYLLARSCSQGLTGLAGDAMERGQAEEALGYQLTNLAWSAAFRQGSLISLMIGVAQESIALECVERWVLESHPDSEQLGRMLTGLRAAHFQREDLQNAMKREIYLADGAFTELLENNPEAVRQFDASTDQGGWQFLIQVLPRSYWRSEHKAYLNVMLANQDSRRELSRPSETDPSELLPFSFAARQLAPMTLRAQAQFMVSLTRFNAMETVVALELYQREHGLYPDSLEQLVPQYLPELPKDVISPKLWARKPALGYRRAANGYTLQSQSQVYESIGFKSRQTFGPDGNYKLEPLPNFNARRF